MSDSSLLEPGWSSSTRAVNGVHLHLVEAGDPEAPLLLLLHGFPEFWWTWHRQIPVLAEAGFHVVAPDLRGYHRSDAPRGVAAYRLDTLADDVIALADSFDAEDFELVGHDWGAVIAWRVAARIPGRVRHLVPLAGPHPDVWLPEILSSPAQALRSTYAGFFQPPWVPEKVLSAFGFRALRAMMRRTSHARAFPPGDLERYAEAWSQPASISGMLNYYRALRLRRAGASAREAPARIMPPTLILWAEHDVALRRRLSERSLERCERGRLSVVPGTSHWLHLEQPQRIADEIIAFLRETRS